MHSLCINFRILKRLGMRFHFVLDWWKSHIPSVTLWYNNWDQLPVPGISAVGLPQCQSLPGPGGCCRVSDSVLWACSTPRQRADLAGLDLLQPKRAGGWGGEDLHGWSSVTGRYTGGERGKEKGGRRKGGETPPWQLTHQCVLPKGKRKEAVNIY